MAGRDRGAGPPAVPGGEDEYILGTDRAEIDRLRFQHVVWVERGYALWSRAGLRQGMHALDLGCGPGFTTLELATVVGPEGRVVAVDESERFLAYLRAEIDRIGLRHVETLAGPLEAIDLPDGAFDAAYGRWILCWLPDPSAVLERVARGLRPGGVVLLQDYLDWAAMTLLPRSTAFDRAVDACMASWRAGGGTIDIVARIPELAGDAGLEVESLVPISRVGGVGSLEWRWLGGFLGSYLPKLVAAGRFETEDLARFRREWRDREEAGTSFCVTPTMCDVILRTRTPRGGARDGSSGGG